MSADVVRQSTADTTGMGEPDPFCHSVSVAAVIIRDDGRILAVQRRDDAGWEPPGGVLERHEDITQGLIREVREEAGVIIRAPCLTGVYKHVERGIVALVFRARIRRREWVAGRTTGAETVDVRWLTRHEVIALMEPVFAARVLDALDHRTRVAVRLHNGRSFRWAWQRWSARRCNAMLRGALAMVGGVRDLWGAQRFGALACSVVALVGVVALFIVL